MKTYNEFRAEYEEQRPASVPQAETYIGEYPLWVTGAVGAMFIASAFFSGVHTVPIAHDAVDAAKVSELLRQAAGISAFVFVESGVLISAYMLVKRWSWVMALILLITISVAMGANLYSVAQALQDAMADTFTKVITILFGLVAPLVAGLSGGVFVWLHQSDRMADARSQAKHKERSVAWDKEIKREYEKYKKTYGDEASKSSNDLPIRRPDEASKAAKPTDASQRVMDYLRDNPTDIDGLSSGRLASKLGVSKATANNVQRRLKGGYLNGHDTSGEMLQ